MKPVYDDIEHLLRITETLPTAEARRSVSMSGMVELIIRHRRVSSVFYGDPTVHHLLETNDEYRRIGDRLADVLLGPPPTTRHAWRSRCSAPGCTAVSTTR